MRRTSSKAACVAVLAVLLLAAAPTGAKPQANPEPALGDYTAVLSQPATRSWVQGRFRVSKRDVGKAIVPSKKVGAIFYPNGRECRHGKAPLIAETIPIDERGRFRIRERTQANAGDLVVVWKGRWTSRRSVAGKVVVRYAGCVSRLRWTGSRLP